MQQPHLPRLYLGHGVDQGPSRMLDSPAAQFYASPATYGSTPFASGGMLSPPGLDSSRPFAGAHSPEGAVWEGAWQGGGQATLGVGRTTSFSSTGSPLTPVNPSILSSAFFPQSGMTHPTMHHPSTAPHLPPHPHSHPQQPAPPRKTTLHASTPSFYPGQYSRPPRSTFPRDQRGPNGPRRSDSVSLRPGDDPLRSPTLARRASASPATSSVSVKKDEPKKRKIVVRLPLETLTDDEGDSEQQARLSIFARAPLTNDEREATVQRMDEDARESVALEPDELVGRASHPDEVKMAGLPESIDVYLPGKSAWEEVWDTFEEDMKAKHGHVDLRRPAFLPPSRASTLAFSFDSLLSARRPGHGRTASLFTAPSQLLPPRLRSALDGVKRASSGHASSLSLSFAGGFDAFRSPLTGSTTAVTSPGAISPLSSSTRLTPFAPAFVPNSTLATAVATPLPTSPAPAKGEDSLLAPNEAEEMERTQKLGQQPSGEAYGGDDGAEEAKEDGVITSVDTLVLVEETKRESVDEVNKQASTIISRLVDDKRSPPSRRTSGMSTKTDRTGVASDWTGSDIDSLRSPSLSPQQPRPDLSTELSRALEELGPLDSPEQLPALPVAQVSVEGPADAVSDNSQYGDGELSDDGHGEDGDEKGRKSGSPRRLRSKSSAGSAGFARLAGSHLKVDAELLFEAPSDVDRPSQGDDSPAETSFHRVKQDFEFPPRSAHNSPRNRKVSDAAAVALPSSPESARDEYGLPSLPPLGTFGGPVDLSPNDRLDFGTFGQPGSLAVSPITGSSQGWRPSSTLDAAASEFRPSSGRLNAFASDFVPSLDAAAATTFGPISPSTATFFPPAANETPRRISGSHGPLPPLPLTASKIPTTTSYLDADALGPASSSMRRVISAPVLVHPQPRRPLPSPPLYMSTPPRYTGYASADDDVELLREPGDERAEQSGFGNRSVASVDDPLPEQYAPIRPVLTKEPAPRAVPAIKNGPRLPQETTAGQASPARMGDPRARMDSIDVALPTIGREMGRAVPLERRPHSTGDASSIIEIDDERTASFTDDDDVPLLFLEKLITDQFDHLRTELSVTRSDDKLVELLKSISDRLESLSISASTSGGASHALHPSSATRSRDSTADGSVRPASAPVTRVATPSIDVSPALAYSGFLDDLKATVQPLVGSQLSAPALAGDIASSVARQLDSTLFSLLSSTVTPKLAIMDDRLGTLVDGIGAEKVSESAKVLEEVQNALLPLSELTTLVETIKTHLSGTPATVDLPRIADLESQLAKARSEKAVLSDRFDAEKARHGEEVADLRARLAKCEDDLKAGTLKLALRDAAHSVVKDELDRIRREVDTQRKSLSEAEQAQARAEEQLAVAREELSKKKRDGAEQESRLEVLSGELARAHGEIAGLEKRIAAQDERLATLQRLKAVQQQSLAAANQRNSDLRTELTEFEQLKETLKEVQAERETARTQEAALQDRCKTLVEENDRFRRQFDSLQQGLETMKVTVRRELEDADARVAAATAERDRLAAENARLVDELSSLQPLSTPSTPVVVHHPSPQGKLSGDHFAPLQPQHTGSSAGSDTTIAHTDISPTPSISSQSFTRAEDGWYTSAE